MLGLPHEDEDDDDNHLCIKCNTTIIGLDNYIKHRKTVCTKEKSDKLSQYHQGADVFFQSLNLQSSVKKPSVATQPPPVVSKAGVGVLTRRTVAALISNNKDHPTTSSDLFLSQKRGEDWIGGQNIHVADTDDNQTKLIKAVASISGKVKKEFVQTAFPAEYNQDEESNDESDDYDDFEDEDHIQTGGKWKPPIASTGGKWKPNFSRETPSPRPDADQNDEWEEEHTGGKWKLFLSQPVESFNRLKNSDLPEIEDDEADAYRPPPGHTRGKWIPGANNEYKLDHKTQIMDVTAFHKVGGSLQFWCGPCNRKLSSRKNYEKHLASSFHLKKTLPEKDLEFSGTLRQGHHVELGKRESKPSHYVNDSIYLATKRKEKKDKKIIDDGLKKKRRKRKVICVSCKSNVKYSMMGKHLISHYHFRKADTSQDVYSVQILENIHKIVLQSPFQCSPCKFYCNWESELLKHWKSKGHAEVVDKMEGRYWCSMCKYEEEDSSVFEEHLSGKDHQEFVAAINRSMPVIIRKKSVIKCGVCDVNFKYNIQLNRHIKHKCFGDVNSTASDKYQGKIKCNICSQSFKSLISLSRHMSSNHGLKKFICSKCNEEFNTSEEAKAHRKTQRHQINKLEQMAKDGITTKDLSKSCPHCDAPRFQNIIILKRHIESDHQDKFYSCFRCGMKFPLSQDVTWHIRNGQCKYNISTIDSKSKWTCNFCPFVTDSPAECWYHILILHDESRLVPDSESKTPRFSCPICRKILAKDYFRLHLKSHTGEREYECFHCNSKFFRKSAMKYHIKRSHSNVAVAGTSAEKKTDDLSKEQNAFLCSFCGANFSKKFSLKQHLTIHLGRQMTCSVPNCGYAGRSAADIKIHMFSHNTTRPFHCQQCTYSAKTKAQLGKHMKSHDKEREMRFVCSHCSYKSDIKSRMEKHNLKHTGEMPFKCPHCAFMCRSLENLRKHILKRNKHSGKLMYQCTHCNAFQSNFAKDMKTHVVKEHIILYEDVSCINEYISNLLKNPKATVPEEETEEL